VVVVVVDLEVEDLSQAQMVLKMQIQEHQVFLLSDM
jgi:hypothetical protein